MKLNTLGVCGGNGVILYPFRDNLLGNIEPRTVFHTPDDIQWNLNFDAPYDKVLHAKYKDVDIIIGGPDCGHSSVLAYSRAKKLSDPTENTSLQTFIESIRYYKPRFFLLENLARLIDNMGADIEKVFQDYKIHKFVESVEKWGNSQVTRIRLVIIGVRSDLSSNIYTAIRLPDKIDNLPMSGELIKGLKKEDPELCHIREADDYEVHLWYDNKPKISLALAKELWMTEFKDKKKWPVNHGNLKNQPGVYRNFKDDPPLTVRKQNRQFNHRGEMLTPREMARIQGLPDSFKIWYDPTKQYYCINKGRTTIAKSPPYEISKWFYNIMSRIDEWV